VLTIYRDALEALAACDPSGQKDAAIFYRYVINHAVAVGEDIGTLNMSELGRRVLDHANGPGGCPQCGAATRDRDRAAHALECGAAAIRWGYPPDDIVKAREVLAKVRSLLVANDLDPRSLATAAQDALSNI